MAAFDPTPNPKNDPSYMGYSQGTEKASLQPLASVPDLSTKYVQPDYVKSTALGKLFENVGELVPAGVKLTDNIIKENINKDLTKGIDQIRDSFGVAAAADQRTGLAQAAGQSGTEGTSLTDNTPNKPLALQRLGTKIDGLYEAYQQGNLSNSQYYAKMEAYVRETKSRYPGYGDEVDSMTREKLGVNPANALRAALQDDVAKLASKVQSQNDKWTTFERSNSGTIYTLWPNYDEQRAKGKISNGQVEAEVGRYNAKIQNMDVRLKGLSLLDATDKDSVSKVKRAATEDMTSIVNDSINGLGATLGVDGQKLQQYLFDVQSGKRPLPTPDEKATLTAQFAQLEQKVSIKLDEYLTRKISDATGSPTTVGSLISNPTDVNNIKNQALSRIAIIKEGLFGEKVGLMGMQAAQSKAMEDAATNSVLRSMPAIAEADAVHKRLGDSGVMDVFMNSQKFRDPLLNGFQTYNWGKIAAGGYSIRQVLEDAKREGADNGDSNRQMIEQTLSIVKNPDKMADPTVSQDAVKHLYGPDNRTLIEGVRQSNSRAVSPFFNALYATDVTKEIAKMPRQYQQMYRVSAEDAFSSVFNVEVDNANQTVEGYKLSNLKLAYDPDAAQFRYEGAATTPKAIVQAANSKLIGFNGAIKSMQKIWEGLGETNTTANLNRLLPVAGIEPGTPMYKLLDKALREQETTGNPR